MVAAFWALMATEAMGTAVFLAIFLRGNWRANPVGRHLALYASALLGLYVTTLASYVVHWLWLGYVFMGLHVVFDLAIWQRVWLVWKAHQQP